VSWTENRDCIGVYVMLLSFVFVPESFFSLSLCYLCAFVSVSTISSVVCVGVLLFLCVRVCVSDPSSVCWWWCVFI